MADVWGDSWGTSWGSSWADVEAPVVSVATVYRAPPQSVTFRPYNWGDMSMRAWGPEWNVPEVVYEFSNNDTNRTKIRKESTDMSQSGIYRR